MMETRREERILRLVQALRRIDKLHLKEAAKLLGVSEMTIRRDLSEQPAAVILLGGYIVNALTRRTGHYFVSDQKNQNVAKKQQLAPLAAGLIEENDIIWFDCGTTLPLVVDAIDDQLPFTAICSAINTFLALREKPCCRVILCGGEFHADNAVFTPLEHHSILDVICPDKAFVSAAGIDKHQGVTCYNLNELPMKHQAMTRARQKILIADNSKFGKVLPARIGDLALFDVLVSNAAPPDALGLQLQQQNITQLYP